MSEPKISRRRALAGMGTVSLGALLAACGSDDSATSTAAQVTTDEGATATVESRTGRSLAALFDDTSACTLTPQETEGPYYFEADRIRSDITEDRPGAALRLAIRVRDEACQPLRNAVVDIWHCDGGGIYSGFEAASAGAAPGQPGAQTDEETYLRGAQVTDADGIVEFETIYPGWYPGRTVHIHAKVHVDSATLLTTQLYFDDAISASVYAGDPAYKDDADRGVLNESDGIFDEALLLDLSEEGDGYLGTISFDLQPA